MEIKIILTSGYSPEYNPVELCFNNLKTIIRKNLIKNELI